MAAPRPPLSAANRTFAIPELLENILLHLNRDEPRAHYGLCLLGPVEQLFTLQRINRAFHATIQGSSRLHKKMFQPEPECSPVHCGKCLAKGGVKIVLEKYVELLGRHVAGAVIFGKHPQGSWRQIRIMPAGLRCQLVGRAVRVDFRFEEEPMRVDGQVVNGDVTCGQIADEMRLNEDFSMHVDAENIEGA